MDGHHDSVDRALTNYDPPTDVDTDVSMLADDSSLWSQENEPQFDEETKKGSNSDAKESWKTPKNLCRKKLKKQWMPPSPFTPMPVYDAMKTPKLKEACKDFGIKAAPKKKMITILKNIYEETHKYETDSEFETSITDAPASPATSSQEQQEVARDSGTAGSSGTAGDSSDEDGGELGYGENVILEESYIATTDGSKGKGEQVQVKKDKIRSFIKCNQDLYLKVLQYETLELDEFRQQLKDARIIVGCDIVMDTLDELNIQFTMRERNRWGGKGTGSPKRRPKKSSSNDTRNPNVRGRGRGRGKTVNQTQV